VDRFLQEGVIVPTVKTHCRPVQFIVPADDKEASIAFYRTAFEFPYDVIRSTKQKDYKSFAFGKYGEHDYFFMLHVHGPEYHTEPRGPVSFSLLVDDLGAYHDRLMLDPSGNRVELVQAWGDDSGPGFESGCRPVGLKLAADDLHASIAFYEKAFGLTYDEGFVFGEYGSESFFQLQLVDDPSRDDRPGLTAFSFLVDDLDAYHAQALAAGATELAAPREAEGMPRASAVRDPSGNTIGLAQG
jgi:predicted enzyme related to lactoylglutathione lyase